MEPSRSIPNIKYPTLGCSSRYFLFRGFVIVLFGGTSRHPRRDNPFSIAARVPTIAAAQVTSHASVGGIHRVTKRTSSHGQETHAAQGTQLHSAAVAGPSLHRCTSGTRRTHFPRSIREIPIFTFFSLLLQAFKTRYKFLRSIKLGRRSFNTELSAICTVTRRGL